MGFRILKFERAAIAVFLLAAGSLAATEHVHRIPATGVLDLYPCLPVREDPAGAGEARAVLSREFQEQCEASPQLGFHESPLWIKLRMRNDGPGPLVRWLEYDNPIVHTLDVLVFQESGETVARYRDGYAAPGTGARPGGNWPMFRLNLPAGAERTVLVRISTPFFVRANVRLMSEEEMRAKIIRRSIVHGVFYGISGFMLIFFVGGLLFLRERIFSFMVPALILFALFFLQHDGFFYAYRAWLLTGFPGAPETIPLIIALCIPWANILTVLFAADLLEIRRETSPRSFALIAGIVFFYGGSSLLYPIDFPLGIGLFQLSAIAASLILFMLLIRGWRQGKRHLRFVFLGFLPAFTMAPLFFLIYTKVLTSVHVDLPIMRFPLLFGLACVALSALDRIAISRRRYTERLAIDVKRKTAQLNTARQHAEDANKFKESLIRMVAHDLRSPLSAVKTNLPLLDPRNDVSRDNRINVLSEITRTLDGVLQFARYLLSEKHIRESAWQKQPVWCDLRAVVAEAVKQAGAMFHLKGIRLDDRSQPVEWRLDPGYMNRILGNILSNSAKFSHPGDQVILETPEPDLIVIRDSGVGMSAEVLDALRQERTVSTIGTGGEAGRGMGMQQCFELVHIQGGTLTIDSTPGGGSRFTIRWPEGRWREARGDGLDVDSPASA